MAPKKEHTAYCRIIKKGATMEIKVNDDTYRVISTKPISNTDIDKIKDAIHLREAQKTQKPKTSSKKFCVIIKK